jgi:hypothetical protein
VLRRSVAAARASFDTCLYQRHLLRLTADAYCLASQLCVKLGEDAMAWVTADRALSVARRSGVPVTLAAYASRLSTAAYTAAKAGRLHQALELIGEAAGAASRLPAGATGFDVAYVRQHPQSSPGRRGSRTRRGLPALRACHGKPACSTRRPPPAALRAFASCCGATT